MKILHTENAPKAIGPYSQATISHGFVFTSGQIGLIPETGILTDGFEAQAEQAIKNVGSILKEAGLDYGSAVKTTCYLKNIKDFAVFNEIYALYFTGKPARSCIEVSDLPKGALIEIEVVAEIV